MAIVYPYEQESILERHLIKRVQVEKHINPANIDTTRYDKILMVGDQSLFSKSTLDKITILAGKTHDLIEWVQDEAGKASEIIQRLTKKSLLGSFQSVGESEIPLTNDLNLTILLRNRSPSLSTWRMRVVKGGSGVATVSFFDAEFGGKLLRTYEIFFSEFESGWYSFHLPNPIFKAEKRLAVSFKVKTLVGDPPKWIASQGLSSHTMLINGTKSDLVPCFETL